MRKVFIRATKVSSRFKCKDCPREPCTLVRLLKGSLFTEDIIVEGGDAELIAQKVVTINGRCARCAWNHFMRRWIF